ncbi:hypothetical protein [Bradymonas sediminis]|uniref:hypothetical protein n=1 Tax=Bradymonas sediminis TaxID=1548548 RepID=UPI00105D2552|nr:hypothetical protein [Bradymonas sediminis]
MMKNRAKISVARKLCTYIVKQNGIALQENAIKTSKAAIVAGESLVKLSITRILVVRLDIARDTRALASLWRCEGRVAQQYRSAIRGVPEGCFLSRLGVSYLAIDVQGDTRRAAIAVRFGPVIMDYVAEVMLSTAMSAQPTSRL